MKRILILAVAIAVSNFFASPARAATSTDFDGDGKLLRGEGSRTLVHAVVECTSPSVAGAV